MRLEAPKDALSYFDEAVKLAPDQAVTYFDRGRANRYAELPDAAARDMERAVKLEPTNPYRVVWLHLVRLRSGQEDKQELTANAERLAKGRWPWPIVELYFDATTPEAVRAAVTATADVRTRGPAILSRPTSMRVCMRRNAARGRSAATPAIRRRHLPARCRRALRREARINASTS